MSIVKKDYVPDDYDDDDDVKNIQLFKFLKKLFYRNSSLGDTICGARRKQDKCMIGDGEIKFFDDDVLEIKGKQYNDMQGLYE